MPESGASLSPDGSQVLFLVGLERGFETYYNAKLFVDAGRRRRRRAI